MTDPKNEVLFCEYCKTCKHKLCDCEDEPCCDCLAAPVNYYSHKPVLWEGVDTLFNKPVERRNYEVERAVRDAVYLNAKDTAEVVDKQGTLAGKVHMRDLASNMVTALSAAYGGPPPRPNYKWGEVGDLAINMLSGIFKSDAKVITKDMLKGYFGWRGLDIPNAVEIGDNAFRNCSRLCNEPLYLPTVKKIGECAFYNCLLLNNYNNSLQSVETIGYQAFFGSGICSNNNRGYPDPLLLDNLKELGSMAFAKCSNLMFVSMNNLTEISEQAFGGCYNLLGINADNVVTIGDYAFNGCEHFDTVQPNFSSPGLFSKVTSIGNFAFHNCTSLTKIVLPSIKTIGSGAFEGCTSLKLLDISGATSIVELMNDALTDPDKLDPDFKIIVADEMYLLTNGGYTSSLAANWYPYLKFFYPATLPYTKLNVHAINVMEDADYRTGAQYTLPLNKNLFVGDYNDGYPFMVSCKPGYDLTAVIADGVNYIENKDNWNYSTSDIDPVEQKYNGFDYGFIYSAGYYESRNKGVNNSEACCKFNIYPSSEPRTITFDIINYAEANYDYGIFGNLDDVTIGSKGVNAPNKWSGKTSNSADVQKLSYDIPGDNKEHFILIKYIKDGSQNLNNDCLKFKCDMPVLTHGTYARIMLPIPTGRPLAEGGRDFDVYFICEKKKDEESDAETETT